MDKVPLVVSLFKWVSHHSFDASVKICRACFIGCNGWPVSTLPSSSHYCKWGCKDLGMGITFSSDSGTLQLFLRCHCMGLICELAILWLLADLLMTWIVRLDKWVEIAVLVFFAEGSVTCPVSVGPTGSEVELVTYKIEDLFWFQLWFLTFLLVPVNAGDKFGGIWISPTSRLGIGRSLYPCVWPSVSPPLLLQWTPWVQWTNRPCTWNIRYFLDCSCIGIWK